MLEISPLVQIPDNELEFKFIRAQGAGGQNVNKVSSAVQLRFDIRASASLPAIYKERLLQLNDQRITREGVIVIRSQEHRTQEMNREAALARLAALIRSVTVVQKKRVPTRPTRSSQKKRLDQKTQRSQTKALRGRVSD